MKRLLTLTGILIWVVAGKAESIDQRDFALDTFSPTSNDVRVDLSVLALCPLICLDAIIYSAGTVTLRFIGTGWSSW